MAVPRHVARRQRHQEWVSSLRVNLHHTLGSGPLRHKLLSPFYGQVNRDSEGPSVLPEALCPISSRTRFKASPALSHRSPPCPHPDASGAGPGRPFLMPQDRSPRPGRRPQCPCPLRRLSPSSSQTQHRKECVPCSKARIRVPTTPASPQPAAHTPAAPRPALTPC